MRTYFAKWGICLLAGLSLAGCDFKQATLMSPEDRITAAFPVSESARSARSVLLDQADEAQKKALSAEFERRLRLRALLCAKGYAPSWLTSPDDIRKNINDGACFTGVDNDITRWLSLRRLGLILAKPPLRAVPANPPEFTVADGAIQTVRFASKAAVALVVTSQDIEVLDMVSGKALLREPRGGATLALSANGRVFVTGEGNQVKVRESETGTVLLDLPDVRSEQFVLADERTLFFLRYDNRRDMSTLTLADLGSGQEVPVNVVKNGVQQILPVPKSKDQYVLLAWRGAYKIEVQRDKAEPEIHLLAEKPLEGISLSTMHDCLTADEMGCIVSSGKELSILALDTLTLQTTSFEPFYIQAVTRTSDKDRFYLTGYMPGGEGGSRMFAFNMSAQTMAAVSKDKLPVARLVYVRSLHKPAQLNDNKIALLMADLPTGTSVGLSGFLAEALDIANQRKLEAFEKQQAMEAQAAAAVANSPIVRAAADAQVEGVGVYQGNATLSAWRTPEGRKMGAVDVRVRPSARPIALVLSSYEPVRWNVIIEPGARLATVLLSSYGSSQVVGAGGARVVQIGSIYAYKLGSSEYEALNQDVKKWTGKGMGVFQGRYEGGSFSVGG